MLDASVAVAWCFEDGDTSYATAALDAAGEGANIHVPAIWPLEVANALLVAVRRQRLSPDKLPQGIELLRSLRLAVDVEGSRRVFSQTLTLARDHDLTTYDASYLELSLRLRLPLCSLDRALREAAIRAGAGLF